MGRLTQTTTNYSFDSAGAYVVQYGYDAGSNCVSMTDPQNGVTNYTYDSLNRLTNIQDFQSHNFGFNYDVLGRRTQLTRPNGVNTNYSYDNLSRLLSVLHQVGVATLDGAVYTYDLAGNRTSKADQQTGVTSNFSYDPIYQLTQVTQGATTTESYTYDAVGNRLSSLGMSPYSYNSSNELTSTPTTTYTYDHNGNLKTKVDASGTTTFNWDTYSNRLSSVVLPGTGGTVSFKYDPFGRRIQKSSPSGTVNYVYDDNRLLEEVDQSGNLLARYTEGLKIDEPLAEIRAGSTSYYEADGLGSITSLTDPASGTAATYTYDAFGKLIASTGTITNPFRYTGREFDSETGLHFYRARYFDQGVGRFVSEDPLRFDGGDNFYAYVVNNPVLYVDPFGLVHYNKPAPDTVPVTGQTASALGCLERCLQCVTHNPKLDLLVTGGAEQSGHSKNSFHYTGQAVDISYWNPVHTNDIFRCALTCGFNAGGAEPKKHHWHLQLTPGNGSRPIPPTILVPMNKCGCQ